ncbi:hypothetical protein GGF31_001694 [Allomyces arbusculus]|nr:hypothetical protein GGF31_001694 [Allomyces arbusculus]
MQPRARAAPAAAGVNHGGPPAAAPPPRRRPAARASAPTHAVSHTDLLERDNARMEDRLEALRAQLDAQKRQAAALRSSNSAGSLWSRGAAAGSLSRHADAVLDAKKRALKAKRLDSVAFIGRVALPSSESPAGSATSSRTRLEPLRPGSGSVAGDSVRSSPLPQTEQGQHQQARRTWDETARSSPEPRAKPRAKPSVAAAAAAAAAPIRLWEADVDEVGLKRAAADTRMHRSADTILAQHVHDTDAPAPPSAPSAQVLVPAQTSWSVPEVFLLAQDSDLADTSITAGPTAETDTDTDSDSQPVHAKPTSALADLLAGASDDLNAADGPRMTTLQSHYKYDVLHADEDSPYEPLPPAPAAEDLREGTYSESAVRADFQAALLEWRRGRNPEREPEPEPTNALRDGTYDEAAARADFQAALMAWRNDASTPAVLPKRPATTATCAAGTDAGVLRPWSPDAVALSFEPEMSYLDRLLLRKLRTETPAVAQAEEGSRKE